jgi:quercetin dioxygenase-like cupin family protein
MADQVTATNAGSGPHHLVIGSVVVSRLLGASETDGELSVVELRGLPGSGPGPHVDAWRETFYVLEGELTFRFESEDEMHEVAAATGHTVTIPSGVPHAFSVSSAESARYLIIGTPAGIDEFFADAGDAIDDAVLPDEPQPFDRERLSAAFAKHDLTGASFPT